MVISAMKILHHLEQIRKLSFCISSSSSSTLCVAICASHQPLVDSCSKECVIGSKQKMARVSYSWQKSEVTKSQPKIILAVAILFFVVAQALHSIGIDRVSKKSHSWNCYNVRLWLSP